MLTDVADNPKFLDAIVTTPGGTPTTITQNGFLNQMSGYANGTGQTTVFSGVLGGDVQLTDKLRADSAAASSTTTTSQSAENTSTFDLDGNPTTTVQQRDVRERQLPTLQPGHDRLGCIAGPELRAHRQHLGVRVRGARTTRCRRSMNS